MKTLIYFLSINAIMYIICIKLGLNRNIYNIDYFLISLLVFYNRKILAFIFLIIFLIIDFILIFSQVFPFVQLVDIMYIINFVFFTSKKYIFYLILLTSFIVGSSFLYTNVLVNKKKYLILILILILINLFFYDTNKKVIFSGLIDFISRQNNGLNDALNEKYNEILITDPKGVTKKIYKSIYNNKLSSEKYLLIINESFGKPKNKLVLDAILKPLYMLNKKIEFYEQSEISWNSATVYGELRELCRAQPKNLNLKKTIVGFEYCLPNELKKYGYKSFSYHAALGSMYDRNIWYKKVGFNEMTFFESKKWLNHCYSFPGGCDAEFYSDIKEKFLNNDKVFIYWLTLNTHSPYDLRDLKKDVFKCEDYNIDVESESCRSFKLQSQFFYNLAELLQKKEMIGVEVFIAGDHTPPIYSSYEKKKYFDDNKIVTLNFKINE